MGELEGRVAVITGGAGGIGRATGERFSAEGASVVLADIDLGGAQSAAAALGGEAIAVAHDVRDSASADALAAKVDDAFGRVDILVNNAGVESPATAAVDVSDEEWDRVLDINARGTFVTTRAFLPALLRQGRGRIINLSSIVGQRGEAFILPYAASKFAVVGMTQSLAAELAPKGITVNSVHPGIIDTGMHERVIAGWSRILAKTGEETWEYFRNLIPQGELQTPKDVAEVIAFIASDRTQHITGAAFNVDGGIMRH